MDWKLGGLIGLAFSLALATTAHASERIQACVRYELQDGWSQGIPVDATQTTGEELNTATNSVRYSYFSTYIVIFWEQHEASVIRMFNSYVGYVESEGIDQEGRHWKVAINSGYCI